MVTGRFEVYTLERPFKDEFHANEHIVSATLDPVNDCLDVVMWVEDD